MFKKQFKVVGISHVVKVESNKSYDILHLVGEPFYPSIIGNMVCTSFVAPNQFKLGDSVSVISHKGDYIVLD